MKRLLTYLLLLPILILSCSKDETPSTTDNNTNNNTTTETFGSWGPAFTNQTANFTQTRTSNLGNEETRTITVNVSTSTSTSTEELLEEDINTDEDLFDVVEITVSTYTASNNLGSFDSTAFDVSKDNDNGLKIGDEFIGLNYGFMEYDGDEYLCSIDNRYVYLYIGFDDIGSDFSDNNVYGNGKLFGLGLLIKRDLLNSNYDLDSNQELNVLSLIDWFNYAYGENVTTWDQLVDRYDYYQSLKLDTDGDGFDDVFEIANGMDPNIYNAEYSYTGEYIDTEFCDNTGSLILNSPLAWDWIICNITNGVDEECISYQPHTMNFKIEKNSNLLYTFSFEGITDTQIPISFFYRGYLSKSEFPTSKSGKQKITNKINKLLK